MSLRKMFVLLGFLVVAAAVVAACGTKTPEAPAAPQVEVPYLQAWQGSAHNAVDTEPFRHWDGDDPAEVPTNCAKCHTSAGYRDFLGADGSEAGKVDAAVPAADAQGVQCVACHNPVTLTKTSVVFPSGINITGIGDDSRCMECHQGRESKVSVDKQISDFNAADAPDTVVAPMTVNGTEQKFGFRNIHYFAAAATLYGGQVHGGYEYDGKTYDAKNTHTEGYATCIGCHNQHTLEVRVDQCAQCHEGVAGVEDLKNIRMVSSNPDYDGDGNTDEGMYYEIQGLQENLMAAMQAYAKDKAGVGIAYDAATYPYFMADANGDGAGDKNDSGGGVAYPNWTPRLLEAAYNYQVSVKDPGAFAHGNKYIVQLLYDSIEDVGGDTSKLARTDAGHFAGDTMPFRDWDDTGVVPFGCVKCHTAQGLPTFLANGGSTIVTSTGTTVTTGLANLPSSNGFLCSTCHDEANWPNRYQIKSVTFPSGKTVSLGGKDADGNFLADDSNLCISCHMGRESTTSVNNALRGKDVDAVDAKLSFKNIHYLAAGATLFGTDAKGAYEYDGKTYLGQNVTHPVNKCKECHDVHALEPKVEICAGCHSGAKPEDIRAPGDAVDYDGDGNVTEGMKGEIETLAAALYAQIQDYAKNKAGTGLVYDTHAYPYFYADKDGDGQGDKNDSGASVAFNGTWTPRLLKAAFNYQYSQKDPGVYVHNPKYVIQFLIDSIADLGGNVSGYTRP